MSYQSTLNRKTRQQKIQASARAQKTQTDITPNSSQSHQAPLTTHQSTSDASYAYVAQDLKKIGWITIVCLVILGLATLLISDIPFIAAWRTALHLPTL